MEIRELKFLKEIDLLKKVERQTLIHSGGRRENSAEHSWHLATAVFVMRSLTEQKINLERALLLALFHDVVEIDAGDTFVYAQNDDKFALEEKAIKRLAAILPDYSKQELIELFYEYEKNENFEARYVNALDRFLPIYANYLNDGYSWRKHSVTKQQVIDRNKEKIILGLPKLWDFVEEILKDGIEKGYLLA